MTVSALSPVTTGPRTASGPTSKISSDFDTFLRMLTVQMQNQDPLNPIDSADYAVQLATFSGVEQQVRTNQLLADMQGSFQKMGLAELAGWIGQEARSPAPVRFDGTSVGLSLSPQATADRAVLLVRNAQGALIAREEVPPRPGNYQWLGADASGNRLPPGLYSFAVESLLGDKAIDTRPVETYSRVVEVRSTPQGPTLVLEGGGEIASGLVTALRLPQG